MSPFKANYGQDPRMGFKRRKKGKYAGAEKFVEKMKVSQTSFGHISINSPSILTVSMATESP